jgi:hypothetical protein
VASSVHGVGEAPGSIPLTLQAPLVSLVRVTVPVANVLVWVAVVALKRPKVIPAPNVATAATVAAEPAAINSRFLVVVLVVCLPLPNT